MPKILTSKELILASGSETRKKMLESLGLDFKVIKSKVDEEKLKKTIPELSLPEQGMYLAKAKAQSVSALHPNAYVIGADQVCDYNGRMFEKPGNRENAIKQLTELSGQTHYQHCSTVIYFNNQLIWSHQDTAILTMRNLTRVEIEAYIDIEQPFNSCGSFMFEKHGKHLFSNVEGDQDVILGLPLVSMLAELYRLEVVRLG
jgi:septum formation protein